MNTNLDQAMSSIPTRLDQPVETRANLNLVPRKAPPIGVPIRKRKPTRYEIHRRRDGEAPPVWDVQGVIVAMSARGALREWCDSQDDLADDALATVLRAIPIRSITQVRVEVEQRSTLTFV